MCLAVPARIVECRDAERAVADLRGSRLEVSTLLAPRVRVGDWVLLHTGFVIQRLTPESAERLLGEMSAWNEVPEGAEEVHVRSDSEVTP